MILRPTKGNQRRELRRNFPRQLRRDLLLILLFSLAFQAFWGLRLAHPSYFDAYYYTTNAQRLAAGQGFTEEIIWQYLDDPAGLPHPSHTYWMPLPSLIGAAGYALTGTFRGAQIPFWLMTGLLPLLGYAISWRLSGGQRWQAWAAALLTTAGGWYAAKWVQPSTFGLFAWVGGGCLFLLALAQEHARPLYWALAGLAAGLAHLARADGILLLGVAALLWLWQLVSGWPVEKEATASVPSWRKQLWFPVVSLLLLFAGYILVMAPWFWRTWHLSGRPLSTVGTQTIFLTTYNDVFAYGRSFDLAHYLAWGWQSIILSKIDAVWLALQTFIGVTGLTAFTFFMVAGWISRGRREGSARFLRPFTLYTLLLFLVMTLVFTFPGQRGSLLHSSTALWPWSMALVPVGIERSVVWVARRRRAWQPEQAQRIFATVFVLMAYLITFAVSLSQPRMDKAAAVYEQVATLLPGDAVLVTGDPPGFYYHTGLRAIAAPNEPPEVLLEAADRYGATYLLLDEGRPPPLADLYEGEASHPRIRLAQDFGEGYRLYQLQPAAGTADG